jgi:hypothetical protein
VKFLGRIRVAAKKVLCRFVTLIEFCRDCGRQQPITWHVDDELWAAVSGRTDGGGVLCPECFDRRAWKTVGMLRWTAVRDR